MRLKTGGAPAGAPDDAHEKALAALAKIRGAAKTEAARK